MPPENNNLTTPDGVAPPAADATASPQAGSDESTTYSADEFRKAIAARDAAKTKARAAEDKLAELEKREKQRQLESMTLEQQNETLKKELEEFQAKEATVVRKKNADAFLFKVVEHTKLDPAVARGLLLAAKEDDKEFDIAPETFTANEVKHAASVLRKLSPSSFEPKVGGAPTPAAGTNIRSLPPNELPNADRRERVIAAARAGGFKNLR